MGSLIIPSLCHCVTSGDKPTTRQINCLYYTDENNKKQQFRLIDRIKPRKYWRSVARALNFPSYSIETAKDNEDEAAEWIMDEWLRGANASQDDRPITWGTLLTALDEANMREEVDILLKYIIISPAPLTKSKRIRKYIMNKK